MFIILVGDSVLVNYIWIFVLFSIAGWTLEVIFHAITSGKFINRGFLNGPWCPIYGFGVVGLKYLLSLSSKSVISPMEVFIVGAVLCTILEYLVGFILDKIYKQKWWDYSNEPFNIGGYVCLRFSLLWGLACLGVYYLFKDARFDTTLNFDYKEVSTFWLVALVAILIIYITDAIVTIIAMTKLAKHIRVAEKLGKRIHNLSDDMGEPVAKTVIRIKKSADLTKENYDNLIKEYEIVGVKSLVEKRLLRAFPNFTQGRYSNTMLFLRDNFRIKKQKHDEIVNFEVYQNAYLSVIKSIDVNIYNEALAFGDLVKKYTKKMHLIFIDEQIINTAAYLSRLGIIDKENERETCLGILSNVKQLELVAISIYFKDENYDGSGEFNISALQIPFASRVLRVVDLYYRTHDINKLIAAKNKELDPLIVDNFVEYLKNKKE